MTSPEQLEAEVTELRLALQNSLQARDDLEARHRAEVTHLQALVARQGDLDQLTAERNNARLELGELQQEYDRLRAVVAEVVTGVTTWTPDLTPVGTPPENLAPELHAAWIRDQIASRRQEWDTFVHRVVTQATV